MRKLLVFVCLIWGCSRMDGTGAVVQACDEESLRAAIAQGGTVTFGCSGTITLTQSITITTNVALSGVGAVVTISGSGITRLFNVSPGVELRIHSLELTRGVATNGGAIFNDGGSLVLAQVTFFGNGAIRTPISLGAGGPAAGGAIYSRTGFVISTDCTFSSNVVVAAQGYTQEPQQARGGAICMDGGTLTLTRCSFIKNSATGGQYVVWTSTQIPGVDVLGAAIFNGGTASVHRCHFTSNDAVAGRGNTVFNELIFSASGGAGGRVFGGVFHNAVQANLLDCTFVSNTATGGEGGPGTPGPSPAGSGGSGGGVQGGVLWNRGLLRVSGSTFATNMAVGGAGGVPAYSTGGNPGTPGGGGGAGGVAWGGAIYNGDGAGSYVTNCTVAGNVVRGGNGINGGIGGPCLAAGCTTGGPGGPGGNAGSAAGGGLYVDGGRPVVVHCTFDGNQVMAGTNGLGGPGGGGRTGSGAAGPDGTPGITSGGAISGGLEVANSIFSRSVGSTNCSGRSLDHGVNISTDNSACFTNPASMKNQDAGLGAFGDHGGPTPTIALLGTSVAINSANNTFATRSDVRGVLRSQGKAPDVGAFEAGYLAMVTYSANAWFSYGAPPGTVWRLEGQPNAGDWRDLGTTTADVRGYAHYGRIRMTNSLEVFRTRKP